jgi:hypothetical protein
MSVKNDSSKATRVHRTLPEYCLKGISGAIDGKVYLLYTNTAFGKTVIGRESDCNIILDFPEVSRHHAAIQIKDGEILLEDLGSSNGTFVDGDRIQKTKLSPGQEISFENLRFVFKRIGTADTADSRDDEKTLQTKTLPEINRNASGKKHSSTGKKTWLIIIIIVVLAFLIFYYFSGMA